MKQYACELLKDKNGRYSLREAIIILFVFVVVISWVAQQFFGKNVPEYMFYSFASLIGAGCFGYSMEKKSTT